jgi:hypothetical protein
VTTRPTTESGAPSGSIVGPMDRKIVTGPAWKRSGPSPFDAEMTPMSGGGVEPGLKSEPIGR